MITIIHMPASWETLPDVHSDECMSEKEYAYTVGHTAPNYPVPCTLADSSYRFADNMLIYNVWPLAYWMEYCNNV